MCFRNTSEEYSDENYLLKDNVWEILRAYTCQETNMSTKFIRRIASKLFKACDCKGVSSNHHTKSAKEEKIVSAKEVRKLSG